MSENATGTALPPHGTKSGLLAWWHDTPLYLRIIGGLILGVLVGWKFGPAVHWLETPA